MKKKANKILAIIFLIFAIGVLAVGITWSSEVKSSMKDTEVRLAQIQQNINSSTDDSVIATSVESYNQNVKVYNSYLDMYDMGFKLIMTLIISDLVVVIILIAMDKTDEDVGDNVVENHSNKPVKKTSSKQNKELNQAKASKRKAKHENKAEEASKVKDMEQYVEVAAMANSETPDTTSTVTSVAEKTEEEINPQPKKINMGGQSTIELTKQLRNYKNMLAAGEISEAEFQQKKDELLKSI